MFTVELLATVGEISGGRAKFWGKPLSQLKAGVTPVSVLANTGDALKPKPQLCEQHVRFTGLIRAQPVDERQSPVGSGIGLDVRKHHQLAWVARRVVTLWPRLPRAAASALYSA